MPGMGLSQADRDTLAVVALLEQTTVTRLRARIITGWCARQRRKPEVAALVEQWDQWRADRQARAGGLGGNVVPLRKKG